MKWSGSWPTHALAMSRTRLEELKDEADLRSNVSSEIDQAISRFLVVRACGHIEFSFEEAFCEYASVQSSAKVGAFVRSQSFRGANPNPARIIKTLDHLDGDLARRFEEYIDQDDQELRRELALLVDRRNKIAHGQNEGVTRRKALDLADVALRISDWLIDELSP